MIRAERVRLTKERETYLATLYGKAMRRLMGRLRFYRNLIRHLRYEFSADSSVAVGGGRKAELAQDLAE